MRPNARKNWHTHYGKLREKIFQRIGIRCTVCGFADPRALQIDHVNGGGNQHRQQNRVSGTQYMKLILKELDADPLKYQILCANCNCIKRHANKELGGRFNKWKAGT